MIEGEETHDGSPAKTAATETSGATALVACHNVSQVKHSVLSEDPVVIVKRIVMREEDDEQAMLRRLR